MKTFFTTLLLLISLNLFSQDIKVYKGDNGVIKVKSTEKIYSVNLDTTDKEFFSLEKTYSEDNKTVKYKGVKIAYITTKNVKLKKYIILHIELVDRIQSLYIKSDD